MKLIVKILIAMMVVSLNYSCNNQKSKKGITQNKMKAELTAKDILGNPEYLAMSYGGYRHVNHDIEPTLDELKEDMKLLSAMGVKIVRTYKVHLPQAANLLQAISELKKEDSNFEMYVMLGVWIDCKNAWTDQEPDHNVESEANKHQIDEAVRLANKYPDIVKIIAVGNEAMVKWAAPYYVQPNVILKWVNHLQQLKQQNKLPKDLWITSSDNFASWGGGSNEYHVKALEELIKAVDYLSVHTYPMHDTHYNPQFWGVLESESALTSQEQIDAAMVRSLKYAKAQYEGVKNYMESLGVNKPIHIGETGWASNSNGFYGNEGSKATDQYKEALYYNYIRNWTNAEGISCFYFEAFNEPWKDGANPEGSENHFGLFTVDGKAKFALWKQVDKGVFKGLTRNGNPITKTYNGNKENLLLEVQLPPIKKEITLNH